MLHCPLLKSFLARVGFGISTCGPCLNIDEPEKVPGGELERLRLQVILRPPPAGRGSHMVGEGPT